jgi:lariat debranching enzyme
MSVACRWYVQLQVVIAQIAHIYKLSSPQVFISHDWPATVEQFGDVRWLLRVKKHFQQDVQSGSLGSPPLMGLLRTLRPQWWFSAHLHVRYEATVPHVQAQSTGPPPKIDNPDEIVIDDEEEEFDEPKEKGNPDEIVLDEEESEVAPPPPANPPAPETHFLALDKCLPKRKFVEVRFLEYYLRFVLTITCRLSTFPSQMRRLQKK